MKVPVVFSCEPTRKRRFSNFMTKHYKLLLQTARVRLNAINIAYADRYHRQLQPRSVVHVESACREQQVKQEPATTDKQGSTTFSFQDSKNQPLECIGPLQPGVADTERGSVHSDEVCMGKEIQNVLLQQIVKDKKKKL